MFDKLEDLIHHYEELMNLLSEPDVANDANRFKKLMKEQSDLAPIVETYKKYKECKQNIEDSLAILDEESDEEMRELAKEELKDSKEQVEEFEKELKYFFCQRTLTMTRTSSSKSVPVQAERKQHFLQRKSTVCMCTTQRTEAGRWRHLMPTRQESAV